MKPVLILKTGESLPSIVQARGDFEDWITAFSGHPSIHFQTIPVHIGVQLPEVSDFSGIIVTGSPAMVTEDLPWIRDSKHFLLAAMDKSIPVLGICFGHQLLAHALGGVVDWHPQGREIGTPVIQLDGSAERDPLFHSFPSEISVHVTHMQSVITLPPDAQILGCNDFEPHHAVRFGEKVWGVQFHPEFDEDIIKGYIRERLDVIKEEGLDAEALLAGVSPALEAQKILGRFVKLAREAQ